MILTPSHIKNHDAFHAGLSWLEIEAAESGVDLAVRLNRPSKAVAVFRGWSEVELLRMCVEEYPAVTFGCVQSGLVFLQGAFTKRAAGEDAGEATMKAILRWLVGGVFARGVFPAVIPFGAFDGMRLDRIPLRYVSMTACDVRGFWGVYSRKLMEHPAVCVSQRMWNTPNSETSLFDVKEAIRAEFAQLILSAVLAERFLVPKDVDCREQFDPGGTAR